MNPTQIPAYTDTFSKYCTTFYCSSVIVVAAALLEIYYSLRASLLSLFHSAAARGSTHPQVRSRDEQSAELFLASTVSELGAALSHYANR